jgi:rhomboid family GlyGly-CTERM serine protease
MIPAAAGRASATRPPPASSPPWLLLSLLLGLGALAMWVFGNAERWNWQPALAGTQPWRWWSAGWVHLGAWHLGANLVGLALIALFGHRCGVTRGDAAAWLLAWPMTHLALLLQPSLTRYAGLSGVLHAGVVIAALRLVRSARGERRLIGAAVLLGVLVKLLLEEPWRGALRVSGDWGFAVAPAAHLAGACAGAVCALVIGAGRAPAADGAGVVR